MATAREQMLAGDWYLADDPELVALAEHRRRMLVEVNDPRSDPEVVDRRLRDLLAHVGEGVVDPLIRVEESPVEVEDHRAKRHEPTFRTILPRAAAPGNMPCTTAGTASPDRLSSTCRNSSPWTSPC